MTLSWNSEYERLLSALMLQVEQGRAMSWADAQRLLMLMEYTQLTINAAIECGKINQQWFSIPYNPEEKAKELYNHD